MTLNQSVFGTSVTRLEDEALLRGTARFTDDITFPGTLAAAFVRSPLSHATIKSIDTNTAKALPGVHAVFTLDDLLPHLSSEKMSVGLPSKSYLLNVDPMILADKETRYVGEAIAVVIADSRYIAEDAAELVEVDYDMLAEVSDCRVGLENNQIRVHTDTAHNLVSQYDFDFGDIDKAFDGSNEILVESFYMHRGCSMPIECRGVLVNYDDMRDHLTVWSSTQRPHALKRLLCDLLRRHDNALRVIAPAVGGGFGPKLVNYPEEVVIALSAVLLGRPVKWIEDRFEHFLSTTQERDQFWNMEITFDSDAMIKGVRGKLLHDHGAYTARGVNIPYASAITLPLAYNIPAYHLDIYVVLTNKVPATPVRGAGQPQGVFVMERLMDRMANKLSLDRAEVRMRNLVTSKQMPCRKAIQLRGGTDVVLDSGDYPATQNLVLEHAQWDKFKQKQKEALAHGRYIGIGLANFVEGTGRGPYETVTVKVTPSGEIIVSSGATAMGQSTDTMLSQIVAEQLGNDLSLISVISGDTDATSLGFGGFNSRQTVIAGASAHAAAVKVRNKALALAGELLEVADIDLQFNGENISVVGSPEVGISLGELARAAAGLPGYKLPLADMQPGLEASESVIIDDMVYSNGSAVAEVEVDIETGQVTISRFLLAHDCGRMINPTIVDGQIVGAIAHGIGNALFEWMGFDDEAQPVTTTLADYLLVSSANVPLIELFHHESASPLNELGVKGVGESGCIPTPAAIISAIEDALSPLDIKINQAPVTPAILWELINNSAESTRVHWQSEDLKKRGDFNV